MHRQNPVSGSGYVLDFDELSWNLMDHLFLCTVVIGWQVSRSFCDALSTFLGFGGIPSCLCFLPVAMVYGTLRTENDLYMC